MPCRRALAVHNLDGRRTLFPTSREWQHQSGGRDECLTAGLVAWTETKPSENIERCLSDGAIGFVASLITGSSVTVVGEDDRNLTSW